MSNLRDTQEKGMAEIIRQYVVKRFDENPTLEKEWDEGGEKKRSLNDIMCYIEKKAHELAEGKNSVAVEDSVVYGWVNHYLEEEGRAEVKAVEPTKSKPVEPATVTAPTPKPKKEKKKVEEQGTQLPLFTL